MTDRIRHIRALSESMTPEENHHLASAEYIKLRMLILALTPASLPLVQQAFAAPSLRLADELGATTAREVAVGAFTPDAIYEFDNLLRTIDEQGAHADFGFDQPGPHSEPETLWQGPDISPAGNGFDTSGNAYPEPA
ncbi:hypothetical protein ACOI1H_21500 [Loktanella sp. DJP18]|uniref:hypothetical protein n=1 Tax=Loktanella sp. DJP18 TaxID=3409788 RepID=UPI003BB5CC97